MASRRAGLLLHPTSLPAPPGGLAAAASRFLEWCVQAGVSVWQLLPVHPPGPSRSPYGAQSAFAGDPSWFGDDPAADERTVEAFVEEQAGWLHDWCLFAALKTSHGGAPWTAWEPPLRRREPSALAAARRDLAGEIARHARLQYVFDARWRELRAEAAQAGVALLGDVPIYMALDSADVWAHPQLFWIDGDGAPTRVAGVPPDYFSETGQLWGNPLYRWDAMRADGYRWWVDRLAHALTRHDALRLDHFRGFAAYWAVAAEAETAVDGVWEPGPGRELFEAVRRGVGRLPFVAEDLGVITPDVVALRRDLGLPGTRVLQFGFDDPASEHAPHRLERDVVVYTGTHDNDTANGWLDGLDDGARARVLDYVGGPSESFAWSLVRVALTSVADVAIVPVQDLLGLRSEARMNRPGIADGNWGWRLPSGSPDAALAARFRRLVDLTGRRG